MHDRTACDRRGLSDITLALKKSGILRDERFNEMEGPRYQAIVSRPPAVTAGAHGACCDRESRMGLGRERRVRAFVFRSRCWVQQACTLCVYSAEAQPMADSPSKYIFLFSPRRTLSI